MFQLREKPPSKLIKALFDDFHSSLIQLNFKTVVCLVLNLSQNIFLSVRSLPKLWRSQRFRTVRRGSAGFPSDFVSVHQLKIFSCEFLLFSVQIWITTSILSTFALRLADKNYIYFRHINIDCQQATKRYFFYPIVILSNNHNTNR